MLSPLPAFYIVTPRYRDAKPFRTSFLSEALPHVYTERERCERLLRNDDYSELFRRAFPTEWAIAQKYGLRGIVVKVEDGLTDVVHVSDLITGEHFVIPSWQWQGGFDFDWATVGT